ncbi:AAA family ATPase [Paenalkalicoccus suaedae]|uniref:AAA family ATPase n=1 Tax=Paenalkalicoccus suaedae TaxID=2592382 RepID=A0A859FJ64_9BACI|nr:AAA family ATPase [Paenalkalicoccus suaedae]QKS72485.1 AAA family ATPase [Paenalkalicoccus suaedae]
MEPLYMLIVSDDIEMGQEALKLSEEAFAVNLVAKKEAIVEIDKRTPDILLVADNQAVSGAETIQTIASDYNIPYIIFLGLEEDFNGLRDVIRAGADEYYLYPQELDSLRHKLPALLTTIQSQEESASTIQAFKRGKGKVFSFFSGKGGSGTTLLSLSFAQTLKLESTARVLFIDLNMQYGGAETFFGLESNRSLADLLPVVDELNETHIQHVLEYEKRSKLDMLLSPCDAEFAEEVTERFISKLIRTARRSYDFVILDLPHGMNVSTYTAMEESDKIYYVLTPDTPSIRTFQRVENLFDQLSIKREERLEFFLNKVSRDNELNKSDLQSLLTYPIALEVRLDVKGVQSHVNVSEPMHKSQEEKKLPGAAKDIRKWVRAFLK